MAYFSSTELVRNFAAVADRALESRVVIERHGRERLVLMSVKDYRYLVGMPEGRLGGPLLEDYLAGEEAES